MYYLYFNRPYFNSLKELILLENNIVQKPDPFKDILSCGSWVWLTLDQKKKYLIAKAISSTAPKRKKAIKESEALQKTEALQETGAPQQTLAP